MMRLEYENLMKSDAITSPTSKFYEKPLDYAMWKYAYYVCHKCNKVAIATSATLACNISVPKVAGLGWMKFLSSEKFWLYGIALPLSPFPCFIQHAMNLGVRI